MKSQYLDHLSSIAEVESTPTDLSSSIDDSQTMSLSQKQRVEMAKMTQSSTKRLSFTGKIGKQLRSLDGSAQKIPKVGIWKDGHLVGVHEDSNSIKYDDIKHHLRDTMSGDNNGLSLLLLLLFLFFLSELTNLHKHESYTTLEQHQSTLD